MTINDTPEEIWARQYPYGGFCFGPDKPTVHIVQEKGKQVVRFEGSALNGEIRKCIYPDFSLDNWIHYLHDGIRDEWLKRLGFSEAEIVLCDCSKEAIQKLIDHRASGEKSFVHYFFELCPFEVIRETNGVTYRAPEWIPTPIPQVWIQWHSDTVSELKRWGSPYSSQPHRIDFAMFWNNQRYAILLDGIQHYAIKKDEKWIASEEEYAKRLDEDRFLRLNDWYVFRISNWELRNEKRAKKVFNELEEFVGFEFRPELHKA
jgi:hypothetical protein